MHRSFRLARLAPSAVALLALAACTDLPTSATPTLTPGTLSLGGAPRASHDAIARADFVTGQVIVRYREGADAEAVAAKHRGRRKHGLELPRTDLVEVAAGDERDVVAELNADSDVEFAELDYLTVLTPCDVGICQNADDSFNAPYKWDLHNTGRIFNGLAAPLGAYINTGKVDADIDWVEMFDALGGDAFTGSATIGILDSGIRPDHQEFAASASSPTSRIVAARNFATSYPVTLIEDRDGHGSHVAGIAAAPSDKRGVTGVAYGRNIKLINAKVCERYLFADGIVRTSCAVSSQAAAIVWATDMGANVLNLSIGGAPNATSGSSAVKAAFQYALSKNTLPVCAAGNDNYPGISFPGRESECLAVGATNWSDTRASYSNYSADLDVVAPGGAGHPQGFGSSLILSVGAVFISGTPQAPVTTYSNTSYSWKAGTSMAAPQVAGLAALLYARGMTSAAEVRARILSTTDDLGPTGFDNEYGHGRINAYRALTLKDPGAAPIAVVTAPGTGVEGTPITFDGSASSDPNNHPITFAWSFGDGLFGTGATPTHTYIDNGSFAVRLTVRDESGRTTAATSTQTVLNANPTVTLAMPARVMSGGSAAIDAAFGDLGIADSPWSWSIEWGNGRTSGVANAIGAIEASRRYCGMGDAPVRLEVTDKDGGMGFAETSIEVLAHALQVSMPATFNVKSNGRFPVRIHGSATLDVRQIDLASLTIAGAGVVVKNNETFHAAYTEGADGFTDLVVHVSREALADGGMPTGTTHQWQVNATLADGCTLHVGRQGVLVK